MTVTLGSQRSRKAAIRGKGQRQQLRMGVRMSPKKKHLAPRLSRQRTVVSSLTTATALSFEDAEKIAEQVAKDGLDQSKE